jgi:hypothetical protein
MKKCKYLRVDKYDRAINVECTYWKEIIGNHLRNQNVIFSRNADTWDGDVTDNLQNCMRCNRFEEENNER